MDPSNNTAFDPVFGQPTMAVNAYGNPVTTTYDPMLGLPATTKGPNGDTTSYSYDALGRPTLVTDPFNLTTVTSYSMTTTAASDWTKEQTVSVPSTISSTNGAQPVTGISAYAVRVAPDSKSTVTTYYDRMGRPIRTLKDGFKGLSIATDTIYDTYGQMIAVSLPYDYVAANQATNPAPVLWTVTAYDSLGRMSKVTAPNGVVTDTTYEGRATLVKVSPTEAGATAQTNATVVDAKGHTVAVWNAKYVPVFSDTLGTTGTTAAVTFKLDGFGRMRETDLNGTTVNVQAKYDALGHQIELNDPDKGKWTYTSSALGHVLNQKDANQNTTATGYDLLGRPITRTNTEPSAGQTAAPVETANWYY